MTLIPTDRTFRDCFGTRHYQHVQLDTSPLQVVVPFGAFTYTESVFEEHRASLVDSRVVVFVLSHNSVRLTLNGKRAPRRGSPREECQACFSDGEVLICRQCGCYWHKQCGGGGGCLNCSLAPPTTAHTSKRTPTTEPPIAPRIAKQARVASAQEGHPPRGTAVQAAAAASSPRPDGYEGLWPSAN